MIAAFLFLLSLLALLEFFLAYSRSLIEKSKSHKVSEETRELCGIPAGALAGNHFPRLAKLIALCAETGGDGNQVRAISMYFRLLEFVGPMCERALPATASWIAAERAGCAYAAFLFLDRRISHNRLMLSQRSSASY